MAGPGRTGPAKGTKRDPSKVNVGNMGKGRKKNVPNKVTKLAREVIQEVIDGSASRVQEWLDKVAEKSPKDALAAYTALLEFGVPKLQRTELTGKNGGPVVVSATPEDERL